MIRAPLIGRKYDYSIKGKHPRRVVLVDIVSSEKVKILFLSSGRQATVKKENLHLLPEQNGVLG